MGKMRRYLDDGVKEIHCIVMVPRQGSHKSLTVPKMFPEHESIEELEPSGLIHTQPNEVKHLTPFAAMMHASRTVESDGKWDGTKEIIFVVCVHTCRFRQLTA